VEQLSSHCLTLHSILHTIVSLNTEYRLTMGTVISHCVVSRLGSLHCSLSLHCIQLFKIYQLKFNSHHLSTSNPDITIKLSSRSNGIVVAVAVLTVSSHIVPVFCRIALHVIAVFHLRVYRIIRSARYASYASGKGFFVHSVVSLTH